MDEKTKEIEEALDVYRKMTPDVVAKLPTGTIVAHVATMSALLVSINLSAGSFCIYEIKPPIVSARSQVEPVLDAALTHLSAELDRRIGIPTNAPGVVTSQTFIGSCTRCSAPMQIVASSVPSPGAWVCSKHVGEGTGGSQP